MTNDLLDRLAAVTGARYVLTGEHDMAPYLVERRGLYHGKALAIVRPGSTAEVAGGGPGSASSR